MRGIYPGDGRLKTVTTLMMKGPQAVVPSLPQQAVD